MRSLYSRLWWTFCVYEVIDTKQRRWRRMFGFWRDSKERFKFPISKWHPLKILERTTQ